MSPIFGYLVARMEVSPFTLDVVVNHSVAEQFADIGVILLLFDIGLRFHLRELIAVGRIARPWALVHGTISALAPAGTVTLPT